MLLSPPLDRVLHIHWGSSGGSYRAARECPPAELVKGWGGRRIALTRASEGQRELWMVGHESHCGGHDDNTSLLRR